MRLGAGIGGNAQDDAPRGARPRKRAPTPRRTASRNVCSPRAPDEARRPHSAAGPGARPRGRRGAHLRSPYRHGKPDGACGAAGPRLAAAAPVPCYRNW